jgi:DNA-binding CsgD family transcriptional regulator
MNVEVRSEDIYEALFDDEVFANLPNLLSRVGGSRASIIQWRPIHHGFEALAYNYFTPEFMDLYARKYTAIDPWVVASLKTGIKNSTLRLDQYVDQNTFRSSSISQEFLRDQGDDTGHCMGAVFESSWGEGIVSVLRGRRAAPFEPEHAARLNVCVPHLRKLLQVRGELAFHRSEARLSEVALDAMALACIIVREGGRILRVNAAGDAILRRADGLFVKDGALVATDGPHRARLVRAIAAATATIQPEASAVVVDRRPDQSTYLITVTPISGKVGARTALLLFRDPDFADESLCDRLRALFGLTKVEALIAIDISMGHSPPKIAMNRGVRASTIKTQLASIAAKMGCRRQSEIAALIAGLPAIVS